MQTTKEIICFPGSDTIFAGGPISVKERDNVRLRCAATGHPTPTVQWRRLDTSTIELGAWKGKINSLNAHQQYIVDKIVINKF